MLLDPNGLERIDHRYDSDTAFYQDNLTYCLRRLQREKVLAEAAARGHSTAPARGINPITLLRRVWSRCRPAQPDDPALPIPPVSTCATR